MFDTKQFVSAIEQIAEEKGVAKEKIIEAIQLALAAAYKKDYGEKGQIIRVKLDPQAENSGLEITQIKYVVEGVDEEGNLTGPLPQKEEEVVKKVKEKERPQKENAGRRSGESSEEGGEKKDGSEEAGEKEEELRVKYSPEKHILLEEAVKTDKKLKVGDELVIPLEPKTEFGRIAAQTAKQVIIQKLREVEREVIYAEFKRKEGEVVSGTVQRREGPVVFIDLGKTNGILPISEQLDNDNYRIGQRFKFFISRVEETNRGPVVLLSRSYPRLVSKLFEFEVPEIESGSVEIKALAREAGSRTKIAVFSTEEGVDPIGSLVGQKGVRVQMVINELSGEKIDIIEWSENQAEFIAHALSPAKIINVEILDENRRHALVRVNDDQFSLAIGKKGQNVRLAAKITGWKIDVRSPKEVLSSEEAEVKKSKQQDKVGEQSLNEAVSDSAESPVETKSQETTPLPESVPGGDKQEGKEE